MASTEFVDPYLDPETGQLRNKVGAGTKVALDDAEGDLSFARLMQLLDRPVKPTGGFDELRAIHRHLFQDVYDWAGEPRTVEISKGGDQFQFRQFLDQGVAYVHGEIKKANFLRGLKAEEFAAKVGKIIGDLNYAHPFREGNGRTQFTFLMQLGQGKQT